MTSDNVSLSCPTFSIRSPMRSTDPPIKVAVTDSIDVLGVCAVEELLLCWTISNIALLHQISLPIQKTYNNRCVTEHPDRLG